MSKVKFADLSGIFESWFGKWYAANSEKYGVDDVENMMPALYEKWLKTPNKRLGCAPQDYYKGYSVSELVDAVADFIAAGKPVCDVLCDEIAARGEDEPVFCALKKAGSEDERAVFIGILNRMESKLPLRLYVYWVRTGDVEPEIREMAAENLKPFAAEVADELLKDCAELDEETAMIVADVAVGIAGDERVYALLCQILRSERDVALSAAYLEKFGDPRAIPLLTEYIEREGVSYAEFIELRNAIESLGGEVTVSHDFSNDEFFKMIKGSL